MTRRTTSQGNRRIIGIIAVVALAVGLFAGLPAANASRFGCVAIGALSGDCAFVSPGGTVKAVGAATAYSVVIYPPGGPTIVCIAGSNGVEQKSCPAPQGSLVQVHARIGFAAGLLLWT